jgi:hypothetical protein
MCDDQGRTIEAPLPVFPAKGGEIKAAPDCDSVFERLIRSGPAPEEQRLVQGSELQRALAIASAAPRSPQTERLSVPTATSEPIARGVELGVYRPPRG